MYDTTLPCHCSLNEVRTAQPALSKLCMKRATEAVAMSWLHGTRGDEKVDNVSFEFAPFFCFAFILLFIY